MSPIDCENAYCDVCGTSHDLFSVQGKLCAIASDVVCKKCCSTCIVNITCDIEEKAELCQQ